MPATVSAMTSRNALHVGLGLTLCLFAVALVVRGERWMTVGVALPSDWQPRTGFGCLCERVHVAGGVPEDTRRTR